MTTSTVEAAPRQLAPTVTRLLVTTRVPNGEPYRAVGFLTHDDDRGYCFTYLRREVERVDFRPLPGLTRAVDSTFCSRTLFPIFAERVISSRRPDRGESMAALGLPVDAAPFEVLVRSQGQRVGDTIELLPAPHISDDGSVSFLFLSHGVRHIPVDAQARISRLAQGEKLLLRPEPNNPINPGAQMVTDADEMPVGWLPDPLISLVEQTTNRELTVEKANGPEVGFHFRLLVRFTGELPLGLQPFEGPLWATVDKGND